MELEARSEKTVTRSVNEIEFWYCALATGQASPFKDLLKREKPLFFMRSFEKEMVSKRKNGSWMGGGGIESFGYNSLPWELMNENALTVTTASYKLTDFLK